MHRCYPKLIFPGERVSSSESFLGRWPWTPCIAWKASPSPAHSHCLLSGAASNARAPSFIPPRSPSPSCSSGLQLGFFAETTASTPSPFHAASELDPLKIVNGSAETVAGGFGVSAAWPFPRQSARYTSIHPPPPFSWKLSSVDCRVLILF